MRVKAIRVYFASQAWVCSKCGNRRCSISKPLSFGCTVASNKMHSWHRA